MKNPKNWTTKLLIILSFPAGLSAQKAFIPEPGEGLHFSTSSLILTHVPTGYKPHWKANSQELLLLRENIFGLSHFSIAYGAGYSWHYIHGNLHIDVAEDGTQSLVDLTGQSYLSNRIALEFADAAIELRYRGKANNNGRYNRLYLGAVAGYRTYAYSYYKDENYRVKFYNVRGFNNYRTGLFIKVGRGPINLYAQYGLSPIVTSGPMLDQWSQTAFTNLGLSITL